MATGVARGMKLRILLKKNISRHLNLGGGVTPTRTLRMGMGMVRGLLLRGL